jgi:hypothetical protein
MELDANWVAAIASVASATVVAITAVAAFMQIRHVRNSNEITVFLKLVERLDSLEAEATFAKVDAFAERVRNDVPFRGELAQLRRVKDFREIAVLLQYMEHLSTLIVTGRITEQLVLAEYADNIETLWDRLADTIYLRRAVGGPYVGAAFEHVAMRAKRFLQSGEMDRLYGRMQKDPRMAKFKVPSAPSSL